MSEKLSVGRKVNPMLMLGGRASFAHQDGVAIVVTDVKNWIFLNYRNIFR